LLYHDDATIHQGLNATAAEYPKTTKITLDLGIKTKTVPKHVTSALKWR
jgi:hypothetical protein